MKKITLLTLPLIILLQYVPSFAYTMLDVPNAQYGYRFEPAPIINYSDFLETTNHSATRNRSVQLVNENGELYTKNFSLGSSVTFKQSPSPTIEISSFNTSPYDSAYIIAELIYYFAVVSDTTSKIAINIDSIIQAEGKYSPESNNQNTLPGWGGQAQIILGNDSGMPQFSETFSYGGSHTDNNFELSKYFEITTNSLYQIEMNAWLLTKREIGSTHLYFDPIITIADEDPNNLYSIILSDGIGNSPLPTPTPEPSTYILFMAGLVLLITAKAKSKPLKI